MRQLIRQIIEHPMMADYSALALTDFQVKQPDSILQSFYKFLVQHTHDLSHAAATAKDELGKSSFVGFGEPSYFLRAMHVPVFYANGESNILKFIVEKNGIVLTTNEPGRKRFLPFSNPKKALMTVVKEIMYGGKRVRYVAGRLAGRRRVFGWRGAEG